MSTNGRVIPFGDPDSFLHNVLESSTEYSIIAADPSGRILLWNEGARRSFGYSPDEILGQDARILAPHADIASGKVDQVLESALASGKWEGVLQRRRRNGEEFPAQVVCTVLRDQAGAPLGFLLVSKDITDEERLHRQLMESEEYNRRLFELHVDAMVTTDAAGIITNVNRRVEELSGRTRAQLIGTPLRDYFTEPARADEGLRRVLAEDKLTNFELRMRPAKGEELFAAMSATALRGPNGRVEGVVAAVRDVTEQKTLENQLREAQTYTRGLIEASADGLTITDLRGSITDINKQMETLTGLPRRQLVGTRFGTYFTDPERAEEVIRRALSKNRVSDYELTVRTPDGVRTAVSYNATTYRDEEGRVKGIIAAARDITEQMRLRAQLELRNQELETQNLRVAEASLMKSRFLANMSHELRTPLNSIIGFSDLLLGQENVTSDPELNEYLRDILNSGHHLLQLINDVLDLAKIESGKLGLVTEPFSLPRAVEEVVSVMKASAMEKGISLTTDLAPTIDSVRLDPLRFKQILYNLLSNSVKFTDSGGRVVVSVYPHDDHRFALRVEDNGIGIAPEDLPRLFKEFEQLDAGPGRSYEGSGLGLSLTKMLVELHGGTIDLVSAPKHGSTFTVLLPYSVDDKPGEETKPRGS
jgi:PAS domain S-box-containing protein